MIARIVFRRPDPKLLAQDPAFIARVMAKWDAKQDTREIGLELMTDEYVVAAALTIGREQRRGA